jgi:hypothetical protein
MFFIKEVIERKKISMPLVLHRKRDSHFETFTIFESNVTKFLLK